MPNDTVHGVPNDTTPTSILLVDDNPANLIALRSILDNPEYQIVTALSGPEALRQLMDADFAVLLLDVRMPGMDGLELARTIRRRERTRHTPIVFLTAEAGDLNQITEGYAAGAVDYIQKPLMPEVVKAKVAVFVSLFQKERLIRAQAELLVQREKTERQTQITALQQANERKVRDLLEAMPQLVWIAAPDGTIQMHNERWLTHSGLSAAQFHSPEEITTVIHPDDVERYWGAWQMSRNTGAPFEAEARLRRVSDGTYRWHLCRAVPARDDEDRIEQWLGTFTDIHTQKSADLIKDEFLATLSHELRTPLNVILGWVDLLQKGGVKAHDVPRVLGIIERNTHLQVRLIGDLLDLSRIITGKLRLEPRSTNFLDIVSSALGSLELIARNKQIHMSLKVEPRQQGYVVFGDANRLQQAVWNVLSNAIKFTPREGTVQVELLSAGDALRLKVIDSGVGIAPEFLPFIFDRFRQEDSSSTRSHGGLGLGLAIVKQLVELHGGQVIASSEGKERGTQVSVELPFLREDARGPIRQGAHASLENEGLDEDTLARFDRVSGVTAQAGATVEAPASDNTNPTARVATPSPSPVPPVPPSGVEGVRILLVDDSLDALDLLQRIFQRAGATVRLANGAAEAMDVLLTEPIDVLVTDIGMPDESGFALLAKVRSLQQTTRLPADLGLVALTAYARDEDKRAALDAGFHMYVTKPVNPETLLRTIGRIARRRLGVQGSRIPAEIPPSP